MRFQYGITPKPMKLFWLFDKARSYTHFPARCYHVGFQVWRVWAVLSWGKL